MNAYSARIQKKLFERRERKRERQESRRLISLELKQMDQDVIDAAFERDNPFYDYIYDDDYLPSFDYMYDDDYPPYSYDEDEELLHLPPIKEEMEEVARLNEQMQKEAEIQEIKRILGE